MKPFRDAVNKDAFEILDKCHLIGLSDLKDPNHPDQDLPYYQTLHTTYRRLCMIFFAEKDETPDDFGRFIVTRLSTYATDHGYKMNIVYTPVEESKVDLPVNHYLLHGDTLGLLKKIYDPDNSITRADVISDDDVLKNFFGSVEKGTYIFERMTDDQWKYISL